MEDAPPGHIPRSPKVDHSRCLNVTSGHSVSRVPRRMAILDVCSVSPGDCKLSPKNTCYLRCLQCESGIQSKTDHLRCLECDSETQSKQSLKTTGHPRCLECESRIQSKTDHPRCLECESRTQSKQSPKTTGHFRCLECKSRIQSKTDHPRCLECEFRIQSKTGHPRCLEYEFRIQSKTGHPRCLECESRTQSKQSPKTTGHLSIWSLGPGTRVQTYPPLCLFLVWPAGEYVAGSQRACRTSWLSTEHAKVPKQFEIKVEQENVSQLLLKYSF